MTPFTENVIKLIKQIPEGRVMTYGQIARLAGSPRAARQVVRILHSMSKKYRLPWHRVVNAEGKIVIKDEASYHEQILKLEAEGVALGSLNEVNLETYRWLP
ncbi:MGMT family protein [Ornithinibacillus sp. BX22]|uniref:MGMT family protein n=2 Tax=Ornithinibacillus TaxID=484508 RepID=A0A923L6D7_9BACI|nr:MULTISPECIES: MGMT family protein [Ornithinibacillus]MBC5637318.1 MGMT family protein [Ornithinibacillus hominis]MBS3680374.1 MGMT family protein [Ornithinibacillus massiliensis]